MVAVTVERAGSIFETVPSPALRTHTAPSPTTSRVGRRPTVIVAVTALSLGSIRDTGRRIDAQHAVIGPARDPQRARAGGEAID
jgi:hypothetical protein